MNGFFASMDDTVLWAIVGYAVSVALCMLVNKKFHFIEREDFGRFAYSMHIIFSPIIALFLLRAFGEHLREKQYRKYVAIAPEHEIYKIGRAQGLKDKQIEDLINQCREEFRNDRTK